MNPREMKILHDAIAAAEAEAEANNAVNDYKNIFEVMIKLHCPTVTVHKGNMKQIISFGAHHTTSYIFDSDDLMDITQSKVSIEEWIQCTFMLSKGDGATITIYNR